jgi:hypothetical protein
MGRLLRLLVLGVVVVGLTLAISVARLSTDLRVQFWSAIADADLDASSGVLEEHWGLEKTRAKAAVAKAIGHAADSVIDKLAAYAKAKVDASAREAKGEVQRSLERTNAPQPTDDDLPALPHPQYPGEMVRDDWIAEPNQQEKIARRRQQNQGGKEPSSTHTEP